MPRAECQPRRPLITDQLHKLNLLELDSLSDGFEAEDVEENLTD
jgi:hypothetical protein